MFFWFIYSDTDGYLENGHKTFCENGRQFLRQWIATGLVESNLDENIGENVEEMGFEDIINLNNSRGPFYEMSKNIAEQCQIDVSGQVG